MAGPAPRPVVRRDLSHQLDHPQLSSERLAIPILFQQFGGSSPNLTGGCISVTNLEAAGVPHRGTDSIFASGSIKRFDPLDPQIHSLLCQCV